MFPLTFSYLFTDQFGRRHHYALEKGRSVLYKIWQSTGRGSAANFFCHFIWRWEDVFTIHSLCTINAHWSFILFNSPERDLEPKEANQSYFGMGNCCPFFAPDTHSRFDSVIFRQGGIAAHFLLDISIWYKTGFGGDNLISHILAGEICCPFLAPDFGDNST